MQVWLLTMGRWYVKKQMTRLMNGRYRRASLSFIQQVIIFTAEL